MDTSSGNWKFYQAVGREPKKDWGWVFRLQEATPADPTALRRVRAANEYMVRDLVALHPEILEHVLGRRPVLMLRELHGVDLVVSFDGSLGKVAAIEFKLPQRGDDLDGMVQICRHEALVRTAILKCTDGEVAYPQVELFLMTSLGDDKAVRLLQQNPPEVLRYAILTTDGEDAWFAFRRQGPQDNLAQSWVRWPPSPNGGARSALVGFRERMQETAEKKCGLVPKKDYWEKSQERRNAADDLKWFPCGLDADPKKSGYFVRLEIDTWLPEPVVVLAAAASVSLRNQERCLEEKHSRTRNPVLDRAALVFREVAGLLAPNGAKPVICDDGQIRAYWVLPTEQDVEARTAAAIKFADSVASFAMDRLKPS